MNRVIEIIIAVCTLAMEAGGEPRRGKIGVAFVIRNRAMRDGVSWSDVCLKSNQFSCWNTNAPTRMNLDTHDDALWAECWNCVNAAMFGLEPDPTNGAYFYLNEAVVKASAGKLPGWWDTDTRAESEVKIGNHTFRQHK